MVVAIRQSAGLLAVFVVLLLLTLTAQAYTVVMRGGRRVEIPSRFIVTATTLTYEAAPGIQITLQISAVDIAATERANNEPPGSFRKRIEATTTVLQAPQTGPPSSEKAKSVTNRDLESYARKRLESEGAYEKRRIQLGLPSVAESRQRAAEESESIEQELAQKLAEENDSENYWRSRASALGTEISAVEAQLGYIRARLEYLPFLSSTTSIAVASNIVPFGPIGRSVVGPGLRPPFGFPSARPNVLATPTGRTRFRGGIGMVDGFPNSAHPGGFVQARPAAVVFPVAAFPNVTIFNSPFDPWGFFSERGALISRFNDLEIMRAGLNSRWRELEEEARRAGVPPGWLRP